MPSTVSYLGMLGEDDLPFLLLDGTNHRRQGILSNPPPARGRVGNIAVGLGGSGGPRYGTAVSG